MAQRKDGERREDDGILPTKLIMYRLRSDKDANFTTAIAIEDSEQENLAGLRADLILIKRVIAQSDENFDWDVFFFRSDTFDDGDLDVDTTLDFVRFLREDARRTDIQAGVPARQWVYDSGPVEMYYEDSDGTQELHVALYNRDNAAKTAGGPGEFVLEIHYDIIGGAEG